MSSETEICNLAISHIGVGNLISNIDTEKSEESKTAKLMYRFALQTLLRKYRFSFFTKFVNLPLVAENPTVEWQYSYRMPNEAAKIIRLISGFAYDTPETRVKYTLGVDTEGLLILTNQRNAQAEITINNPDARFFPADFALALSYFIASLMCPKISGGDVFKITQRLNSSFEMHINRVLTTSQNEEERPFDNTSSFEAARK